MRILLTGATGYIGKRLLTILDYEEHEVYCCVRDLDRIEQEGLSKNIHYILVDLLDERMLQSIPKEIDIAYYLIHSMSTSTNQFEEMERKSATLFMQRLNNTDVKQVIYLSGIVNDSQLSKHLQSRKVVEEVLSQGTFATTTLRAGIIVGSGSASFEIMRDLVEKLPVMVTPKWLFTRSQPIGVRNVLQFLTSVKGDEFCYNKNFDIGGEEVLTYKQMLLQFAEVRGLKRRIYILPIMTPKLSSYWLYFVTSTSYKLAVNLVDSMKIEVVCRPNGLAERYSIKLLTYKQAVQLAFEKIKASAVDSSWIDAQSSEILKKGISKLINVPTFGCFIDQRIRETKNEQFAIEQIWSIGGEHGWYAVQSLWQFRGFLDKLVGGVGFQRGRTHPSNISVGDSLDFWRVLYANKQEKRLLLYAEMKLPGEAWLEFKIKNNKVIQTATFRPLGLFGRIYWYFVLPFHNYIFTKMIEKIVSEDEENSFEQKD